MGNIVLILINLNKKLRLGHLLVGVPPSPFKGEVDGLLKKDSIPGFGLIRFKRPPCYYEHRAADRPKERIEEAPEINKISNWDKTFS